jgi:pimeloyl-ACP methyl ester carboxylesterase
LPAVNERRIETRSDDGVLLVGRVFDGPPGVRRGLVLHHGLASSSHIWDRMMPALTARFSVVVYDARGHGLSGKPSSGYGFDRICADAIAMSKSAKFAQPVVVGHSWGAMAMLELAARWPRSISGAVLVDGGLAGVGSDRDWPTTKELLAPPHLDGMPVDSFLRQLGRWSPVPVTPEVESMFLSLMRVDRQGGIHPRLSRANHLRILRKIWEQRPLDLYSNLRVPVLVIAARSDDASQRGFMESKRRGLAAARKAAAGGPVTFEWMKGVHDLPVQHPTALARRIIRFAEGVVG